MIRCYRCSRPPKVYELKVYYDTDSPGWKTVFRVKCVCGCIGKCRPSVSEAIMAWNSPWQANIQDEKEIDPRRVEIVMDRMGSKATMQRRYND